MTKRRRFIAAFSIISADSLALSACGGGSGISATVVPASDLQQQLSQGCASVKS